VPDLRGITKGGRLVLATALAALLLMSGCGGGDAPSGATTVPTQGATAAEPAATATPATSAVRPDRIEIPAIGVRAPVAPIGLTADGALDVPPLDRPGETGWYDQGPVPGETGPAVVVGHVDANGPAVFFRLRELRPGDRIRITRTDAVSVTFRVVSVEQVPKDKFPTDRVYGDLDHAGLRLVTCGGSFDAARKSYTSNVIVYAVADQPGSP
jgi:LPXTG-site transpeptidase (sortase) family protein